MTSLAVDNLAVRYGRLVALDGVSLQVASGEVLAVLGRNGAGKSSLLQAIAGLIRPSAGRIAWEGTDLHGVPADRRTRLGISLVPEGRRIFPALTVGENIRLGGFHLRRDALDRALHHVYELFPVLAERTEQPAGQLSGGQQQMLCIGRALVAEPRLLLLDEPSLGLAPGVAAHLYERLGQLRRTGITLIIVEQQVERVLKLADAVIVLRLGHISWSGPANEIDRVDPRLHDAYLGRGLA